MKVVILAAGKGTRMLPLTKEIPKVLVEVNGKPFLYYVFKILHQAGLKDIGIVVGYKKEKIKDFLKKYDFKAELIEQKEQLGTGHAVLQAKDFVGQEDFIVYSGDNLYPVKDIKKIKHKDDFYYIGGLEAEEWQKYGVLVIKDNLLVEIKEKPTEFVSNVINTALYKLKPEIFPLLEQLKPSLRGEIELTDAINLLAQEQKVKVVAGEWWVDLGCKEDILRVTHFLEDNWEE
ncbi:MAG: NTP transferase domain-containing protein [Nanoarchaeota archaeon]|nr:NTP transferase domain-containing protein [Nanoarchaeota archaeon]MBU1622691.1 NTP transferase domain-containing protein [Nanoarchaeota archaeon]MBU1974034.1 NTP transferase domain-containing protein [Nanoarchaeota archaeon]